MAALSEAVHEAAEGHGDTVYFWRISFCNESKVHAG
jgi:hypothetical protein